MTQSAQARVLVVDDERVIADTLSLILNRSGFQATAVYDGVAAIEKAHAWKPDILLCDVFMPGPSGVEVAIEIRRLHPQTRILLLSGQADVEDLLSEARRRGHDFHLLVKPVHPADLLKLLRNHS